MLKCLFILSCLAGAVGGCTSTNWADRRQKLLELYPPGTETREQVNAAFGGRPEFSLERPADGWLPKGVGWRAAKSEERIGRPVYRVERFFAADGMFGLCNCWFFYDEHDVVLDAEWQYHSD